MATTPPQYPTREQLRAEVERYLSPTHGLNIPTSPSEAKDWAEQYLREYARENGIPITADELKNIASGYITGELNRRGIPITSLPKNQQELIDALKKGGCAYVAQQTGIDPAALEVTVNALEDGKLSTQELVGIGSAAGAIAGTAIAQAFGIPAPIGSLIGGEAGKMIGYFVADVLGISGAEAEERRRELERRIRAELNQQYIAFKTACDELSNRQIQLYIGQLESLTNRWISMQNRIGWSFDLRWFTPLFARGGSGSGLLRADGKTPWLGAGDGGGIYCSNDRTTGVPYDSSGSIICGPPGILGVQATYCVRDDGCMYPPYVQGTEQIEARLRPAANAFAARGVPPALVTQPGPCGRIIDPNTIPNIEVYGQEREKWKGESMGLLKQRFDVGQRLSEASLVINADLMKTANAVATEVQMRALADAARGGDTTAFGQAMRGAAAVILSSGCRARRPMLAAANTALLLGGAGLLGYSFWEARKR